MSDNREKQYKFITKLIKRGHLSVIEHGGLTVLFKNVSRSMTHQLVRHRLASYSQESLRYASKKGSLKFIDIPHEKVDTINFESLYCRLLDCGWSKEDARMILPIGTLTNINYYRKLQGMASYFCVKM